MIFFYHFTHEIRHYYNSPHNYAWMDPLPLITTQACESTYEPPPTMQV